MVIALLEQTTQHICLCCFVFKSFNNNYKYSNTKCMLDIRSQMVLNYVARECEKGYKALDIPDILSYIPPTYKVNANSLKHIMNYLDVNGYVNIKYSDENVYCLTILPFGRQYIENSQNQVKQLKDVKSLIRKLYLELFVIALLGAFLGTLIYNLLF